MSQKCIWAKRKVGASVVTLAFLTAIVFSSFPVRADVGQEDINLPDISEVVCASYIVYDRTANKTLVASDPDERIYPASMTKILTAAIALEYLDTEEVLTVSQTAIDATTPNSTLMGLEVDEQISVSELLYGLLLPSGNDAANVLAEAVVAKVRSGSTDLTLGEATDETTSETTTGTTDVVVGENAGEITDSGTSASAAEATTKSDLELFADIMNQKIAELGLQNTHFANANGLQNEDHYTTAADLAIIFSYALTFPDFQSVISSPTHVFTATNMHDFDGWSIVKNTNQLLSDPWILGADTNVAKVVGGKTGTTIEAGTGMTLLAVNKNGDEMITVVCGIPYEDANRQTTYVAAVLNAGADACFEADPVIRVSGNVMDNKPYNAPSDILPIGQTEEAEETEPSATESSLSTRETVAGTVQGTTTNASKIWALRHPVITGIIVLGTILAVGIAVMIVQAKNERRRRRKGRAASGIRRL